MFRLVVASFAIICLILLSVSSHKAQANTATAETALSSTLNNDPSAVRFIILIDAGSTGSRVHVHKYTSSESGLPDIQPSTNKKLKPGLSSYADNPSHAAASVNELIAFAKTLVPAHMVSSTPIHLQATAGLRSITEAEAERILEVVRDTLDASGFYFQRSFAKIISGDMEGINGWLAANYLSGVFENTENLNADGITKTTGVVEMGGTSLQITYVPSSSVVSALEAASAASPSKSSHLTSLEIAGRTYNIYTHSYLHYGLQAAEKLYQKLNFDEIEDKGNPCFTRGYRHSATGNFALCRTMVERIMDKTAKCEFTSCSFNSVFQPLVNDERSNFIAIENFFYTLQFFGVDADASSITNGNSINRVVPLLEEKGTEFCNSEWSALTASHPSIATRELGGYCFAAAYETAILTHGLGFGKTNSVRAVREINGKPIDWALGAVLGEILKQQTDASSPSMSGGFDSYNAFPFTWHAGAFVAVTVAAALAVRKYKHRFLPKQQAKYSNAYSKV